MLRHRLPVTLTALLILVLLANCGATGEPELIVEQGGVEPAEVVVQTLVEEVAVEAEKSVQATAAPPPRPRLPAGMR